MKTSGRDMAEYTTRVYDGMESGDVLIRII